MRHAKTFAVFIAAALTLLFSSSAATAAPSLSAPSANAQIATMPHAATVELAVATVSVSAYTCSAHKVVLRLGSRGECVKVFQRWSNRWGVYNWHAPRLAVDGRFGANSRKALILAQRAFGLKQDGVIGPRTWEVIEFGLM